MWQTLLLLFLLLLIAIVTMIHNSRQHRKYQGGAEKKSKNKKYFKLSDVEITHVQQGLKNQHFTRMPLHTGDTIVFSGAGSEIVASVTDVWVGSPDTENWKDICPDAQTLGEVLNKPVDGSGKSVVFRFSTL